MAVACLSACCNVVGINGFSLPLKDEMSNLSVSLAESCKFIDCSLASLM